MIALESPLEINTAKDRVRGALERDKIGIPYLLYYRAPIISRDFLYDRIENIMQMAEMLPAQF